MFIKSRIKSFMNHTLNHSLDHSLFHSLFVTTLRITYWSICWFQAWIMIWFEESWDESCEELHDILYAKPSLHKEWSFLKDFFSWFMWSNPRETADLVTLTERILNKELHFFYAVHSLNCQTDDCFYPTLRPLGFITCFNNSIWSSLFFSL